MAPTLFVSLGMFIIDEIHYLDRPSVYNILGGGGFFALFGSRIALSYSNPQLTSFILDAGTDFPEDLEKLVISWNTSTIIRKNAKRLTTRGWNNYKERDFREFKYLTPKQRIDIEDLENYSDLINSKSFHFICSPDRCEEMLNKLDKLSRDPNDYLICWEPIPDLCTLEELPKCLENLSRVDILTPNAEEAARFWGINEEPDDPKELESIAHKFLPHLTKTNNLLNTSAIVLRCGELGIYICTTSGIKKWYPAYQKINPFKKIVDCTGAGNTNCGAFVTSLILTKDWDCAGIIANIASGLCLEQLGVANVKDKDIWNDDPLKVRIENYIKWASLQVDYEQVMSLLSNKC